MKSAQQVARSSGARRGEILINGQPVRLRSTRTLSATVSAMSPRTVASRGLVMSQSIEKQHYQHRVSISKVKGACGLLSDSKSLQLVVRMVNVLTIKAPDTHLPVNTPVVMPSAFLSPKWLAISPKLLDPL